MRTEGWCGFVIKNDYICLAMNDYKYLKRTLWDEEDAYSRQAVECEQRLGSF